MRQAPERLTPAAAREWDRLYPALRERCGGDDPDAFLLDYLDVYCTAWAYRGEAIAALARENRPLESGPNGARYPSPWFKIIADCESRADRAWRRMGLEGVDRELDASIRAANKVNEYR